MEYVLKKERLYDNGNERLRYRVEYPVIEGLGKINRFFEKIAENCVEFCKGTLYGKACGNNEKYIYVLSLAVTHLDDKAFSVLLISRLFREGLVLSQFLRPLTFDLRTELMIPDKILVRRYAEKPNKCREKDYFLYNGRLVSATEENMIKYVEKARCKRQKNL